MSLLRCTIALAVSLIMLAPMSHAQQSWDIVNGEVRRGTYVPQHAKMQIPLPRTLGEALWIRDFAWTSGQFEVHFGDDQCRRLYVKQIGGSVGRLVAEDAARHGLEPALHALATQLTRRRGENLVRTQWNTTRSGSSLLVETSDPRGWPCVAPFPEGGTTIGAAWLLLRGTDVFEIGYQTGIGPIDSAQDSIDIARREATEFLATIRLPKSATSRHGTDDSQIPPPLSVPVTEATAVALMPPEATIRVGHRFLLPAGSLDSNTGDSVKLRAEDGRLVVIGISDIAAGQTWGRAPRPAVERLNGLLASAPVTMEIVAVEVFDFGPSQSARLSVDGNDVARTLVLEGVAFSVKSRATDPRLLAAEWEARSTGRGLWGLGRDKFNNLEPDRYNLGQILMNFEPECYLPIDMYH